MFCSHECPTPTEPETTCISDRNGRFPVRPGVMGFWSRMSYKCASPSVQPRFPSHKKPRGIDQRRSIDASQACAPLSSIVTANIAGSIDLIDQPSTKAARSSACDTRRGPQSPGWRSLKHIR